jgi:hypothetical protein
MPDGAGFRASRKLPRGNLGTGGNQGTGPSDLQKAKSSLAGFLNAERLGGMTEPTTAYATMGNTTVRYFGVCIGYRGTNLACGEVGVHEKRATCTCTKKPATKSVHLNNA